MGKTGLYIHIPFCDGKCHYCNFYSKCADADTMEKYVDHLKKSIVRWSKRLDRTFDTVYFGGGTPSLLGDRRLISVLDAVHQSFPVGKDAEITLEVNPSSTDPLDFSALRKAGFNRLSIGLQSANENELKLLGRRHSIEDARRTVESARLAGFDNISLDVMLAIPEQTIESLHRTLDFCAQCDVQHISAYILKIEPGTAFYRSRENLPLFDEDAQAAIYEETVNGLENLGYRQYEISNFAKEGYESRHNQLYWHDEEYLGLGPSAHSFIDGRRFYYDNNFDDYYADKISEEGPGGDEEEFIMLALRLREGLVFSRYEERYHKDVSKKMLNAAEELEKQGLVEKDASSLRLTVKGFLVSNSIIAYLLENT